MNKTSKWSLTALFLVCTGLLVHSGILAQGQMCDNDTIAPTVTANTTLAITLNGNGQFTLNSNAVLLSATDNCTPAANLTVAYSRPLNFTGADIPGGSFTLNVADAAGNDTLIVINFSVDFVSPPVACINSINVTLNNDCEASVVLSQLITGGAASLDFLNLSIEIADANPGNGPVLDGCGRFVYTVRDLAPPGSDFDLANFSSCWGYINAEDKTSPILEEGVTPPAQLFCTELDAVNLNTLPFNQSRCYTTDGEGNFVEAGFVNTALYAKLVAGGGLPDFFDGCSNVEICVNDLVANTGPCNDVVITRVFTATDGDCPSASGHSNASTVYSYDIVFTRPNVNLVAGPDAVAEYSCSDQLQLLPPNGFGNANPVPAADDYPSFLRDNGTRVFLGTDPFCNIGATFQDGPRIVTCANTYKFVRTYTVVDWCNVSVIRTFTQLVKVGDLEAPVIAPPTQDLNFDGIPDQGPLFFSANTANCSAFFLIPPGSATDNCDASPTVSAVIYPNGDTLALGFGPFTVGSVNSVAIPRGNHIIRYFARDACGNLETLDVPIIVGDRTAPVAICEDGLNISIGGPIGGSGGSAQLCADNIDRASYDNCSGIRLAIARVGANNQPLPGQSYQNCITLNCNDLGTVRVGLRVLDDANLDGLYQPGIDNSNFCWLDVLVEDKLAPICIPPAPSQVGCSDLSQDFPQDLNVAFANDPIGTAALLDAQFGLANGLDNCPDPITTQTVFDNRNSCGVGQILRTFTVTDGEGFTSAANCVQNISVIALHDYTIIFPGDQENDDCVEPGYNGVQFTEFGCDLITVATNVETFTATADECYKLRITYTVLNWCEYNTIDEPYTIPRDADGDNVLINDITVLHVLPRGPGLADDLAILDRDANRNNFNTINELDTGDGGVVPGSEPAGYGNDGSRGAFIYQQFIKVYDDTPPTLVVVQLDGPFCSFSNDCTGDAELFYSIADECSPASVNAIVELDRFIDGGADGVFTLADFVADQNVSNAVANLGGGNFSIALDDLPIGRHALRIRATDGCGNTAISLQIFEVVDCKAPTPICINGLTATLMPDGNGGGMAAIWVSDFIASPSSDCSGPVKFAIYFDDEVPAVPNPLDTGLLLDCNDIGLQIVRIYAIDAMGNADYCQTSLSVQVFNPTVCPGGVGSDGSLSGAIMTSGSSMMNNVAVNISANTGMTDAVFTTNGLYQFTNLTLGDDYTLEPSHDPAINLSRVTTGDLIIISRHILGLQFMTDEYQLLAGDVTQDDHINVLDIIAIRRVILGFNNGFQATNSWRFYVAGNAGHAETFTQNNLNGNVTSVNFVAIEMGNVSEASQNFSTSVEARSKMELSVEDLALEAGNHYDLDFTATGMEGFQGTLELGAGLELLEVDYRELKAGNFNLSEAANGLIALSHNGEMGELFGLKVRATQNARLSELLKLSDRITMAEAYTATGEVAGLQLGFLPATGVGQGEAAALHQNVPNPVAHRTRVGFVLPTAGIATLKFYNLNGQLIYQQRLEAAAGENFVDVDRNDLKGASGLVTYTLVAGDFVASRKMILSN